MKGEGIYRWVIRSIEIILFPLILLPRSIYLSIGRFLGRIVYLLDKRHRIIAINNLRISFKDRSEEGIEALATKVFENLGMNFIEFLMLPWIREENLHRYVDFRNIEYLDRIKREGKGIIFLTAHFGNWELLCHAMGLKGYKGYIVVREDESPFFRALLKRWRERSGNRTIHKRRAMRRLIRFLNRGGAVGILLDQNVTRREGVFVDFFGRPACTNKGLALLAIATGVKVVPIFIRREADGKHVIEILEAVDTVVTGEKERDVLVNTERFTKVLEGYIRSYPDQWFWVHQRWKTRPCHD